jgi:hypothetical protein
MAGMSNTLIDKVLNATTPTGAAGIPGTWTALSASAMKLKLTSSASSASASGTEITGGSGYTTGGQAFANAIAASSAGSGVTMPITTALSWTNAGSTWSIVSFELTDNAGVRTWFGNFTGQPISVASGNTFQIAVAGISINAS